MLTPDTNGPCRFVHHPAIGSSAQGARNTEEARVVAEKISPKAPEKVETNVAKTAAARVSKKKLGKKKLGK
jgi:hypothetical protein